MTKAVNIAEQISALPFLDGRDKHTPQAEANAAFATLAPYRDGAVFAGSFRGESPWERHPNGDELVHILDGATTLTMIADDEPQTVELRAGMLIVVPQGCWHRFHSPQRVTLLTVTPQPTEHSKAEDPRSEAAPL